MSRRRMVGRGVAVWALAAGVCLAGAGHEWPQWRGPKRDGLSAETGLLKQWPKGGPEKLWTATGIGHGFSSMSIAGGLVYTGGNVGKETMVTALTLDGKIAWQTPNGGAYTRSIPGSRSTPTVDGARVYHKSPEGRVACLDAQSGKELWAVDLMKAFGGRNITWAQAESPLIDGNRVICSPGGAQAAVVALDKATGKKVWVCKGTGDKPGYASPILVEQDGLRLIVTMTAKAAIGLNADTGELLWDFAHKTSYDCNIPTPIYHDGHIFIDSGYGSGGALLELTVAGKKASVKEVWRTKALDNHHGGIVLLDGYLYGSTHKGQWVCLEFKTGKVMYTERGVGKGSITYADGMFYTYSEGGAAGLVKAGPSAHEVVSTFRVPKGGRGPYWAHPVVCNGRLYLRHDDALHCYDIKAP